MLFCFVGIQYSFGQSNRTQCDGNGTVSVSLYPVVDSPSLSSTVFSNIENNTSTLLTAINEEGAVSTDVIDRDAGLADLSAIVSAYCTRRTTYNLLLLPKGENYEVRGIHMLADDGNAVRPQLAIEYDNTGKIVSAEVVDQEMRDAERNDFRNEVSGNDAIVLEEVEALERAYNQASIDEIKDALATVLQSGNVEYTGLRSGVPYSRELTAPTYVRNLGNLMARNGVTEVTYEMINIYPRRDDEGSVVDDQFHVTLIQHFIYRNSGYQDTDFIALDVNAADRSIAIRRGGRGTFVLESTPPGMTIVGINDEPYPFADTTPYFFKNIALQRHYVELADVWYEKHLEIVSNEDILFERNTPYEELHTINPSLTHKDARVKVEVLREDGGSVSGAELLTFDQRVNGFTSGDSVTVMADDLLSTVDGFDGTFYPGPTRDAEFEARLPNYEPQDTTVTLSSPHGEHVIFTLKRLKGLLIVKAIPDSSGYMVTLNEPMFETQGATEARLELDVTGDRDPYEVKVWNETHYPADSLHGPVQEQDYIQYIPEYRTAKVVHEQPTVLEVPLVPMYVHHETDKGMIDVTHVDRGDGSVSMSYNLIDNDDRNRRYRVSMSLMQGPEVLVTATPEEVTCGDEDVPCYGKGLRQGSRDLTFNLASMESRIPEGINYDLPIHPVLTLQRKGFSCNWACVLIPAAAGVASAFIWPRTGKGGDDGSFIPPPRP